MKQPKRYVQRFLIQSTVLLLMSITAFLGVYASGRAAYRSANELGAMTADYLNLQVDSFLREYAQILGGHRPHGGGHAGPGHVHQPGRAVADGVFRPIRRPDVL